MSRVIPLFRRLIAQANKEVRISLRRSLRLQFVQVLEMLVRAAIASRAMCKCRSVSQDNKRRWPPHRLIQPLAGNADMHWPEVRPQTASGAPLLVVCWLVLRAIFSWKFFYLAESATLPIFLQFSCNSGIYHTACVSRCSPIDVRASSAISFHPKCQLFRHTNFKSF